MAAASSPRALAERAASFDEPALAATDDWTLAGAVNHAVACRAEGLKPIHGARIQIDDVGLVLLAADHEGYANLCDVLTLSLKDRLSPALRWEDLSMNTDGLLCMADFRSPFQKGHWRRAEEIVRTLDRVFTGRCFVELIHHERCGDSRLLSRAIQLAEAAGLPTVATNAVRHATPSGYTAYDALCCAKYGVTVAQGQPQRGWNDAGFLCHEKRYERLGIPKTAIANSDAIASECDVDILEPEVTPPPTRLPKGKTANQYLRHLCNAGFRRRYPDGSCDAVARLKKELRIIGHLELEEFFLVVHEVVNFARSRGIRCSGRGSAANSVVAYLLGITEVDPVKHKLLFERFLHEGRKGMPDIDVDFDTTRRNEVIQWMIDRWDEAHTAMTANLVTFRLRSAVREVAKVLGWPVATINQATKLLPSFGSALCVREHKAALAEVLGESPGLEVLCKVVEQLHECPRHLSLHSGGMILSRKPLRYLSPVQTSANGVRQIQFPKDDVEKLGLIKFDVLGLRMLGTISEAQSHIRLTNKKNPLNIDDVPLDDPATFELIRSGETLGLFQIESPGQWNLLSRSQPEVFTDIVAQTALFRPGPLQGLSVNPYVLRRRGVIKPSYFHPSLREALEDTFGIILYQEQVLEVVHLFAGLSLSAADEFRRLMSRFRDPGEMETMRKAFVESAIETHKTSKHPVSAGLANKVFDLVAKFVGYGFCRSHAAAFARTVYQSAYLKCHFPAQYMAGVLQDEPGFYPSHTLLEETRRLGVEVLPPCLLRSEMKYSLETGNDGSLAIRIPFSRIDGFGEESAATVVMERALAPFSSLSDALQRLPLRFNEWENLARCGALDGFGRRREVLWQVREAMRVKLSQEGRRGFSKDQLSLDMKEGSSGPVLAALSAGESLEWDFDTMHLTTGPHPVAFHRPHLAKLGIMSVRDLRDIRGGVIVRVAGSVISRQRPPTAKGMCFIILEDETGRLPTAITPDVYDKFSRVVRAPALVMEGKLEDSGFLAGNSYRSVLVSRIWPLASVLESAQRVAPIVGAAGYPGENPRFATRESAKDLERETAFARN